MHPVPDAVVLKYFNRCLTTVDKYKIGPGVRVLFDDILRGLHEAIELFSKI